LHDEDTPYENVNEMNSADEPSQEAHSQKHIRVFFAPLDNFVGGLTVRFSAVKQIRDIFSYLWNYQKISEEQLKRRAAKREVF